MKTGSDYLSKRNQDMLKDAILDIDLVRENLKIVYNDLETLRETLRETNFEWQDRLNISVLRGRLKAIIGSLSYSKMTLDANILHYTFKPDHKS